MAGGMRRGTERRSLADRSAASGVGAPEPGSPPPALRHCWVHSGAAPLPALLLGWERRADGWYGRVVHAVRDGAGWSIVEEWVPGDRLAPADGGVSPPPRSAWARPPGPRRS